MEIKQLYEAFSDSRLKQEKAAFAMLFILQNQLQTYFDNSTSSVTLKQFMLLIMVRQSENFNDKLTLTKLGELLGCSRQNVKKVALVLEKKGYLKITTNEKDVRSSCLLATPKMHKYFDEIASEHMQKLHELFQVFDDEELNILVQLMNKWQEGCRQLKENNDE